MPINITCLSCKLVTLMSLALFSYGEIILPNETVLQSDPLFNWDERPLCNPFIKSMEPVTFSAIMRIYNFEEVDDVRQTMAIKGTFVTGFNDARKCYWEMARRLMPMHAEHVGGGCLAIDPHYTESMWRPQVVLMNSATDTILVVDQNLLGYPVNAYPDGLVLMNSGGIWRAKCSFDHEIFPFDTQQCDFVFETWVSDRFTNMTKAEVRFLSSSAMTSPTDLWKFESASAALLRDECFSLTGKGDDIECWPKCVVSVKVKRKWQFYMLTVFVPTISLCVLQLSTVLMPPEMPDRPVYSVTLLLAFFILQDQVQNKVPNSGVVVLLLVYFNLNIAASTIITIYTLIMVGIVEGVLKNRYRLRLLMMMSNNSNAVISTDIVPPSSGKSREDLHRKLAKCRLCDIGAFMVSLTFYVGLNIALAVRVNSA